MEKMNARNKIGLRLLFWIATLLLDKDETLTFDQKRELKSIIYSFGNEV